MKNNIQLRHCQQVVPAGSGRTDLDSINLCGVQVGEKCAGILGLAENEKTTRRLGIKEYVLYLRGHGFGNVDMRAEKLPIRR